MKIQQSYPIYPSRKAASFQEKVSPETFDIGVSSYVELQLPKFLRGFPGKNQHVWDGWGLHPTKKPSRIYFVTRIPELELEYNMIPYLTRSWAPPSSWSRC